MERELRVLVFVLLAFLAAATLISLVGPNADLAVAGLFYDPATNRFAIHFGSPFGYLRDNGRVAIATCIGLVLLAALSPLSIRWLPKVSARSAVALTLALLLGPGLMVNGILKPYGGRPRPGEVMQFGGVEQFVNWWNFGGTCEANCSFISGEVSGAAWMFGPAMLVPPPWRTAAIAAVAVFTLTISLQRMASGGHFFTDVLFAWLVSIVLILAMNRLVERWWPTAPAVPRASGAR
jgi:membrane-associated PAP2 superfamily phosphatase